MNIGDTLAGKYRVERVLGVGGMGVVVAARHLQLDELVAVKLMLPEVLSNPRHVARFLREAKMAIRLRGEHVARVLDAGTLETGAPYIAMEYLDGEDLGDLLARRGALPVVEACGYVLQACKAMAEAHAVGIVHRDLKPQNLFITTQPDATRMIKVLDFGIAKSRIGEDDEHYQATQTSAMMGSPAYMSPEQIESSRGVDARSDVWALGVILYQLVSGQLPFSAPTVVELCIQVLNKSPVALRTLAPAAPSQLEAIVARCLEKDREQRYSSIAELVADLAPLADAGERTLGRVSRMLGVPQPAVSKASGHVPTGASTTNARTARRVVGWIVAGSVLGYGAVRGFYAPDVDAGSSRGQGTGTAVIEPTVTRTNERPLLGHESMHATAPPQPEPEAFPPPQRPPSNRRSRTLPAATVVHARADEPVLAVPATNEPAASPDPREQPPSPFERRH